MSGIELTFIGICTHLWEEQPNAPPNPAWGRRVVMGRVSQDDLDRINERYRFDPAVRMHITTLTVLRSQDPAIDGPLEFRRRGEVLEATLDGATVRVRNPSRLATLTKNARCMPSLVSWLPNVAPSPRATNHNPREAAAYFDFDNGAIDGFAMGARADAGVIRYTVDTDGPPEIVIAPFDESRPATTVRLTADAVLQIDILNVPDSGEKDNDNDFILHFLVANQFPERWPPSSPTLGIPCQPHTRNAELMRIHGMRDDFGIGCSNSNIP